MKKAYGVMPPMATVWKDNEKYDEDGTLKYAEWLIDNGIHSVAVCGSTGENITMSPEENKMIIKSLIDGVAGRIPVYAGTGYYSTKTTVEVSQYAEKAGADGLMVILPYYLQPYKKAVLEHFRTLRKNVSLPIMVYNNPWFAGYQLNAFEIAQLVEEGVIDSIKCAHGDPCLVHELKYLCGDKITAFYGHDYNALEGLLAGADGWLSGLPNIIPSLARKLYDSAAIEKNVDQSRAIWNKILPLVNFSMYEKDNGCPHWLEILKEAINMQGCHVGVPRKPLGSLTPEMRKKLEKILDQVLAG